MKHKAIIILVTVLLLGLGAAHAITITPVNGYNHAYADSYYHGGTHQQINHLGQGNPSPWLDPISVAQGNTSGSFDPDFVADSSGATYTLGITDFEVDYGVSFVSSYMEFTIDEPTTYSFFGILTGEATAGGYDRVLHAGSLEGPQGYEVYEYEYENNNFADGTIDVTIGDGVIDSGSGGSFSGTFDGTLSLPGTYVMSIYQEVYSDRPTDDPITAQGSFSLVLGEGGSSTVPVGGSTVLMLGFGLFISGFAKLKLK